MLRQERGIKRCLLIPKLIHLLFILSTPCSISSLKVKIWISFPISAVTNYRSFGTATTQVYYLTVLEVKTPKSLSGLKSGVGFPAFFQVLEVKTLVHRL